MRQGSSWVDEPLPSLDTVRGRRPTAVRTREAQVSHNSSKEAIRVQRHRFDPSRKVLPRRLSEGAPAGERGRGLAQQA
jgi:hypothetical protein